MRTIDAMITSQGQVTIPAEVRRVLGVEKRQQVTFVIEEDEVRLIPAQFTFESAFGAIPAKPGISDDFDDEIEHAMEAEMKMGPNESLDR